MVSMIFYLHSGGVVYLPCMVLSRGGDFCTNHCTESTEILGFRDVKHVTKEMLQEAMHAS